MMNKINKILLLALFFLILNGCSVQTIQFPNDPNNFISVDNIVLTPNDLYIKQDTFLKIEYTVTNNHTYDMQDIWFSYVCSKDSLRNDIVWTYNTYYEESLKIDYLAHGERIDHSIGISYILGNDHYWNEENPTGDYYLFVCPADTATNCYASESFYVDRELYRPGYGEAKLYVFAEGLAELDLYINDVYHHTFYKFCTTEFESCEHIEFNPGYAYNFIEEAGTYPYKLKYEEGTLYSTGTFEIIEGTCSPAKLE